MSETENCPNCNNELKSGLLSSVKLLDQDKIDIINEYHDDKSNGYCNKCGNDLFTNSKTQLTTEKDKLRKQIQELISIVPVVSTHSPLHWDYDVLEMVTGQSTTGTGVITEFTSSITDIFGMQSGRHNKKLKAGEDMCFAQLRKQTIDIGGNAVIATDIDYSEVGGERGMLMVCMAGTIVKLKNLEVLGKEKSNQMNNLVSINDRLRKLARYKVPEM